MPFASHRLFLLHYYARSSSHIEVYMYWLPPHTSLYLTPLWTGNVKPFIIITSSSDIITPCVLFCEQWEWPKCVNSEIGAFLASWKTGENSVTYQSYFAFCNLNWEWKFIQYIPSRRNLWLLRVYFEVCERVYIIVVVVSSRRRIYEKSILW